MLQIDMFAACLASQLGCLAFLMFGFGTEVESGLFIGVVL